MDTVPVEVWGEGEPVILIHGSGAPAPISEMWARQRPLAERYRLLILTRRGYGDRPVVMQTDVEGDVQDVLGLLGAGTRATSGSESAGARRQPASEAQPSENAGTQFPQGLPPRSGPQAPAAKGAGAHLVGFSYGGIVAMVSAARRPELVRSLTVIEPPALGVVRGNPAADAQVDGLSHFEPPPLGKTPEEFWKDFRRLMGQQVPEHVELSPIERKAVEAHMAEAPPWTVHIPLDTLAATPFPKLVVSGHWNPAMDAVADIITERLSAERFVLPGWYHNIHRAGEPFNQRLDAFLQQAIRLRSIPSAGRHKMLRAPHQPWDIIPAHAREVNGFGARKPKSDIERNKRGLSMAVLLGLTGNIASGKTTVGQMLLALGAARYIDADQVVHQLYEPGQPIYAGVVAAFGAEILTSEGAIDRHRLGDIVFHDAGALRRLEAIVHPAVGATIAADIQSAPPDAVLILDAVKLLEGGTGALCKSRWLVICDEAQQLRRLMERNGFSEEEARARLRAQPPIEPKLPLVDEVIDNSGTLAATRAQVEAAWGRFQRL